MTKAEQEMIREAVRQAKEDAQPKEKPQKSRNSRRSRSSGQKEPLILKIDKMLDKWRW